MERKVHTIDVSGKVLGRIASQIVMLLRGKHKVSFERYKDEGDFVEIHNVGDIKITGNKIEQKVYRHHSGYPGGLKTEKMKDLMERKPGEILRKAVYGMLPKNKLRAHMIKRLTIKSVK